MNNPIQGIVNWQIETGQLDHWTSYHIAAGAFICKVAQWLGASDLWAETKQNTQFRENTTKWRSVMGVGFVGLMAERVYNFIIGS